MWQGLGLGGRVVHHLMRRYEYLFMKLKFRVNKRSVVCAEIGFKWSTKFIVCDASYWDNEKLVIVIIKLEDSSRIIIGLNMDETERFNVKEPTGWSFYHMSSHVKFDVTVICVCEKDGMHWHYYITPDSGELTPLNRSY